MIPLHRRLTGMLEVLIGLGLLVGFVKPSVLLSLNPSPFFLFVIYGAWVAGTMVGVLSGVLASVLYLLLITTMTAFPVEALWAFVVADPTHYLTPTFLIVAGYVFGELRMTWQRRLQRLQDQAQIANQEAADAKARLQQAETALVELQGRVLGQTATMKRLYQIAQSLNVLSVEKILLELMGVLEDLLQVEQASIYRVEENQKFARLAVRTGEANWSNSLAIENNELVAKVIREGKILTFAEVPDRPAPIFTVPILREGRTYALIVIHKLPFTKVTADTQELLSILAKWAGQSLERATSFEKAREAHATYPHSRVLREPFFLELCRVEAERKERYHIPYTVLKAKIETDAPYEDVPRLITERLDGAIRTFDFVTWVPEKRMVALLFPTLEPESADVVEKRVRERLNVAPLKVIEEYEPLKAAGERR
jgi:K+-sensing histidine kinase KdpD